MFIEIYFYVLIMVVLLLFVKFDGSIICKFFFYINVYWKVFIFIYFEEKFLNINICFFSIYLLWREREIFYFGFLR